VWLLEKEIRELASSRAWWVLLLGMGPLTGIAFISTARTYAEVSGLNGTSAGVGEALSPLIGIWAPTFSACELAAVFLLPFVAIRQFAGDRQDGTLRLELQQKMPAAALIAAKTIVTVAGWLIAMGPPLSAILVWRWYGGSVYGPELAALVAGHVINAGLTIAVGSAAASVAEHPSTAAILTLSVTVGGWIISFIGAVQGGWWELAAGYTPAAMVADFQHGLVRLDSVLIALVLIVAGLGLAAVWIRLGTPLRRRVYESIALVAASALVILGCARVRASWDASENRANSFPASDERALQQIREPLEIEVHLAPEDPRRVDLERRALSKLRRLMSNLRVSYVSSTSIGLFEQTRAGYGEIWYRTGSHSTMSRATTEEGVLEAIYSVAGIAPPGEDQTAVFRGHPLAVEPRGAAALFFGFWPGLILCAGLLMRVPRGF
jgi:hypothetical protein